MGDFLLTDTTSGAEVRVPDTDAYRGIAEGRLRPRDADTPEGRVRIIWNGRPSYVPVERLREVVSQEGFGGFDTMAAAEDRARGRELARELGPLEAPLAGAAGVLRGSSVSLSDAAARAVGGEGLAADLRVLQERNPIASGVGEVAGAVLPVLSTGGTSLLARGVTAPTRAVTGLAEGAGALTRGALGSGVLGRTAAGIAGGAIEGAAAGAGMLLTDASLGRSPDLTAEAILQDVGTSALLGGTIGGGLSGLGALTRAGAAYGTDAARALGRQFLDETGERLHPTVARWWGALSGARPDDLVSLTRMDSAGIGRLARRMILDGETASYDSAREAVAALRREPVPEFVARSFRGASAQRAREALASLTGRVEGATGVAQAVSPQQAFARLRELTATPEVAAEAAEALGSREIFGDAGDAWRAYQEATVAAQGAADDAAYVAARRRLAEAAGAPLDSVQAAQETLGAFQEAQTISAQWRRVLSVGRRRYSPEASIMGRAILGHVVGGPVAAGIGLGVGIISQPEVAIRLVGALERLGSRLEGRLADSASAVTGAVTGARRASSVSQREALRLWREQRRELDAMTPELMASRVGDLTAQFGPEADEVRPALTRAAVRSLEIRMAITPRATARAGSLTPHLGQLPPSDDELDRFVRLSRVLDDPASLMEGVVDGSIQADEVELLKAAYPATYAAIVGAVMERLTVLEREPSYEHRLALSVLLGVPTDPTLDPLFMQAVQSGFQVSQQPDQMTRPQRPLRADTRPVATEMQELTDGNT